MTAAFGGGPGRLARGYSDPIASIEAPAELLAMADIDGGLIGGASLKPDDFLAIGQAANV